MHVEKVMTWQRLEGFSMHRQEYDPEMDIKVNIIRRMEGDVTRNKV